MSIPIDINIIMVRRNNGRIDCRGFFIYYSWKMADIPFAPDIHLSYKKINTIRTYHGGPLGLRG